MLLWVHFFFKCSAQFVESLHENRTESDISTSPPSGRLQGGGGGSQVLSGQRLGAHVLTRPSLTSGVRVPFCIAASQVRARGTQVVVGAATEAFLDELVEGQSLWDCLARRQENRRKTTDVKT